MMINTKQKSSKVKKAFVVKNDRGLHTRPSTEIVKCASTFKADVSLTYQKTEVNAKSLLGILMLAAGKGSKIWVSATGSDAKEAVDSLVDLAEHQFNMNY